MMILEGTFTLDLARYSPTFDVSALTHNVNNPLGIGAAVALYIMKDELKMGNFAQKQGVKLN
jgi:hypothetical protein